MIGRFVLVAPVHMGRVVITVDGRSLGGDVIMSRRARGVGGNLHGRHGYRGVLDFKELRRKRTKFYFL